MRDNWDIEIYTAVICAALLIFAIVVADMQGFVL